MNLSRIVERWADFHPSKVALHFGGEDIRYAELQARVEAAAAALAALGVARGDRFAWLGYNHPEMLAALLAAARQGAILVPLNFRLAPAEHRQILAHCEAKLLVAEADFHAQASEAARALPQVSLASLEEPPAGWRSWFEATRAAAPPSAGEDRDPVLIVYTSGTTGRPKGVVHTQEGLLWNAVCSAHQHDLVADDHVLTALPMFHVGGLCIQTVPALHAGASVTLHSRFEPGAWLRDVAARRPTLSLLVPAALKAVIAHPQWEKTDLSSLRLMNTGSSVVPDSLFAAFHARGVPMAQVYGATETGPVTIYLRREDAVAKAGAAGKPALHCEVRLVGADGREVAPGEVGEIWVRGKNVTVGYWKDPDNPALAGGWFRSGDLARRDAEGYYWIVGRSKELIISGGENIYPAEIENVLADCPEIAESAVVGVPDERWGEVPVAAVVKKPGSALDEAAVLALFAERLARFKHPKRVVFLDALPKTALGKVQRAVLAAQLRQKSG